MSQYDSYIFSCFSYLHWENNVFPAFLFPKFESAQAIKLVSSKIKFAVPFLTIHNYFSFLFDHLYFGLQI